MNFKKTNFEIIKKAIDPSLADFLFNYLKLRKNVCDYLQETRYISPYDKAWGYYFDHQVPNTYSIYADPAMETLLPIIKNTIEKIVNFKLVETYSYARLYKKGDVLFRHKDRGECAISATLHLGGDAWPIYLNNTKNKAQDGFKVDLKPGDLLIYLGDKMEHWREEFTKDISGQVFLHYDKKDSDKKYDTRPMLGLPDFFKKDNESFPNN
jgi:hypothetical protein